MNLAIISLIVLVMVVAIGFNELPRSKLRGIEGCNLYI